MNLSSRTAIDVNANRPDWYYRALENGTILRGIGDLRACNRGYLAAKPPVTGLSVRYDPPARIYGSSGNRPSRSARENRTVSDSAPDTSRHRTNRDVDGRYLQIGGKTLRRLRRCLGCAEKD